MKKLNLLAIGILCVISSNAQIKYGLKGGLGFAGAKGTAGVLTLTAQSVTKPQLGLTMDLSGSETFNWQTGLLLNVYGGKYSGDGSSSKASIYTLSIPFLANYKLTEKLYGYAGPQLSFSLAANGEGTEEDYDGTMITTKENINENIKKPLIFGVIGGGYQLSDNLKAFAEYHIGLSNAITNNTDGETVKLNLFNLGIQFNLTK
jgi:outer membrane immunogenic protein